MESPIFVKGIVNYGEEMKRRLIDMNLCIDEIESSHDQGVVTTMMYFPKVIDGMTENNPVMKVKYSPYDISTSIDGVARCVSDEYIDTMYGQFKLMAQRQWSENIEILLERRSAIIDAEVLPVRSEDGKKIDYIRLMTATIVGISDRNIPVWCNTCNVNHTEEKLANLRSIIDTLRAREAFIKRISS